MIEFPFFRCLLCKKIKIKKQYDVLQFSKIRGKNYESRTCVECRHKHFNMFEPEKFAKIINDAMKEKYGIDFMEEMKLTTYD
jgi:L-cysteine desulfidase